MIAEHQRTLSKLLGCPVGAEVTERVLWLFKLTCRKTGRKGETHVRGNGGPSGEGNGNAHNGKLRA